MSLAYFNLYPTDFEADTSHLTLEEDGAYNRLLRLCWMTQGCSLPDDDAWIMRRMRVDEETFTRVVKVVLDEFFVRRSGRVSNARLAREFSTTSEAHKKRVLAGKMGGEAKALKSNKKTPSNAKAMLYQPEPEPEPYKEEVEAKASLSSVDDVSAAVSAYNLSAEKSGWPSIRILSKPRRAALLARLRECGGLEGWNIALEKAQASNHCCGQNERGWVANFDFLTRQSSFTKLMEGNYDNRIGTGTSPADSTLRAISIAARMR